MPYRSDTAVSLMVLWTINPGVATAASSVVNLVIVSLGRYLSFFGHIASHRISWACSLTYTVRSIS